MASHDVVFITTAYHLHGNSMSMKFARIFTLIFLMIFIVMTISSCTKQQSQEDWPVVKLPDGADTTSEYWKGIDLKPKPPVKPVSVNEQLKQFLLPPGYSLEPVLTEPEIQQPAAITFDG